MKKVILAVCVLAVVGSIAFVSVRGRRTTPAIVVSSDSFAFDLLRSLAAQHPRGNTAVSPVSVSLALGMLANGARGDTRTGVLAALGAKDKSVDELNKANARTLSSLGSSESGLAVVISNSIWAQQGLALKRQFVETCSMQYHAGAMEVDFQRPDTISKINSWVEEGTHGKIRGAVRSIDPGTAVMLVNTVYFKSRWTNPFEPSRGKGRFYLPDGREVAVPLMGGIRPKCYYLQKPAFQAAKLPYGDGRYSMLLFLPSRKTSMPTFLNSLDQQRLVEWSRSFRKCTLQLYMPKFRLDYAAEGELAKSLSDMGMADAFDPHKADLSGMCSSRPEFVGKAVHHVVVDVNEKGTEAVAATYFGEMLGIPDRDADMIVDRPFFFVIWDDQTKSCLFEVVVNDPR